MHYSVYSGQLYFLTFTEPKLRSKYLQYDARDKFVSCLVLGRRTSESPAIVSSVRRKSAANLARFVAETLVLCGTCAASCCLRRVHQKVIKRRQPGNRRLLY